MTPTSAPGVLTSEWAALDETRWPGVRTRVAIEISDRRVTVRIQCRRDGVSCSSRVPEVTRMSTLAQSIADTIVARSRPDYILSQLRGFQERACACRDLDCFDVVDGQRVTWTEEHRDEWSTLDFTRAHDAAVTRVFDAMDTCRQEIEEAAGPPYVPYDWESTGSAACDEYMLLFDSVAMQCRKKLGSAFDALREARDENARGTDDQCREATDALRRSAVSMGCSAVSITK